jgi:mRNA guanylyltransferase
MRYLLYLTQDEYQEETQYLIDRKNDYWYIPKQGLHFPVPGKSIEAFHINSLIDGELVIDKLPNGQTQPKYLVFDCMVLDGNSLMNRSLDKRIAYFKERVFDPYKQLLKEYPEEQQYQHFIVELKQMQFSYVVEYMFRQILPGLPHGNDGLIFTCRNTEYKHGTDHHILKWKPENENSIDFRLSLDFPLIQPDEVDIAEGITEPYYDFDAVPVCNLLVYAGDGREDPWYGTMFVDFDQWESLKSLQQPLDDRIVECYMDEKKRWRYMRFRDDKTNANHTSTVESVIESITDRVTEKDLITAQKEIRDEWKRRAAEDQAKEKQKAMAVNGGKRKAEEQAGGRPSPGPGSRN